MSAVADEPGVEGCWPWERLPAGRWAGRALLVAILLVWVWILSSWPLTWATLALAGAIAGVAVLLRPALGFPLLALAIPFGSLRTLQVGPASLGAEEFVLWGIAMAWLLRRLARGNLGLRWPALTGTGIVLLAIMLASFLPASSLSLAVKELVKWSELWLTLVLVVNLLEPDDGVLLALGLLGAGAAEGLVGLYQFLTKSGPEGFLLMGRFMRAAGTFGQPNPFGGYLGLTLPLALGIGLCVGPVTLKTWRKDRRPLLLVAVAALAGGLMLGGLFASWSRGAWLGAAAALGVVVVARGGVWLRGAVVAGVLVCALSMLFLGRLPIPQALEQRFVEYAADFATLDVRNVEVTDANFSVVERAAHWQAAIGMLAENPWTGVGLGNYAAVYERYALPRWPDALGHAHNYYLNIAAEAGLPGLAAYLLWLGAGFWLALRAVRASDGLWQGVALGALGLLVHLGVHSLFDNLYVHGMAIQVGLLLGLAAWIVSCRPHGALGEAG